MPASAVAFLMASSLYTGFQWTIRVVVYPQFARAAHADFPTYERHHQRLVSIAVGPLFAALVLSAGVLVADRPPGLPTWAAVAAPVLVGVLLAVTAAAAVPLHERLSGGFDPTAHRRLLAVDTVRLVTAVTTTALGAYIVAR